MCCDLPFVGTPPSRATYIDDHAIPFRLEAWKEEIPSPIDTWPSSLDHLPASRTIQGEDSGLREITRRDVFNVLSLAATELEVLRGYVASAVWGSGTIDSLRKQTFKALGQITDDKGLIINNDLRNDIGANLRSAIIAARRDPVEAFRRLHGDDGQNGFVEGAAGQNRIPQLGPSFGTKVLYFGAYEKRDSGLLRPLIVDRNVIHALNDLCPSMDFDLPPTADQYRSYLELCHRWADQWGTDPDVVERLLFAYGKNKEDPEVRKYLADTKP